MFFLITMVLVFLWLPWSCVMFEVFNFCLFLMHLIIKKQQPCYSTPSCLLLAFCWNHVVHLKLMPLYLCKYTCKPIWKFWWNISHISLIGVEIQIVTNCVLTHSSIASWIIQSTVVFRFIVVFNCFSPLSFCLPYWISFTSVLSMVFFIRISKFSHYDKLCLQRPHYSTTRV